LFFIYWREIYEKLKKKLYNRIKDKFTKYNKFI